MSRKKTTEEFIKEARELYGDKYDYSETIYKDAKTDVLIRCLKHGLFSKKPDKHLHGQGCKYCMREQKSLDQRKTKDEFIADARKIHGDKYDYSKVEYINNHTDVIITCPIHGEFPQTPNSHLSGRGCKDCGIIETHNKQRKTKDEFIADARKIHGDKYDYSKVEYNGTDNTVTIICPIHGDFPQTPSKHLIGQGCKYCGRIRSSEKQKFTNTTFILRARQIHGWKYDYSKVEYVDYDQPVIITCPIHGDFPQTPDSHLQGSGCQKCSCIDSKQEKELLTFIKDLVGDNNVISKKRGIISPWQEIDIFIPSKHIGIEYNGLYWHTEQFGKNRNYHLNKLNKCAENNIKLIHIFEDEYINNKTIVEQKIKQILHLNYDLPKISARKCIIKTITSEEAKIFLIKNHIQGFSNASVHLGCFTQDKELVGVMSFRKEFKENNWELTRFATNINYISRGVGGKLFKYFVENYAPDTIKSFADRRWTLDSENNLYTSLGFILEDILPPDYRYFKRNTGIRRIHKFNMRKQLLLKKYPNQGLNNDMTEEEMTKKIGFHRIWDCGLLKYVWKNKIL